MVIHSLEAIQEAIKKTHVRDLLNIISNGFVLYSEKKVVVPPVGHLSFTNPPGDVHIKFGYVPAGEYYVIKIASGFYENPNIKLNSGNGLMLVFNQRNGLLEAILMDKGYLTDIRTAIAGAIVAKYLAPRNIETIGIIGTGVQARLQLQFLKTITSCRDVLVWGRNSAKLKRFQTDPTLSDFNIDTTHEVEQVTKWCNLIITTTASKRPLILEKHVKEGTHITAVGADAVGKQELDEKIFANADIIVADSVSQCIAHGELQYSINKNLISPSQIIELGDLIKNKKGRIHDNQITVADLTGVAIQDIQIAQYVYSLLQETS